MRANPIDLDHRPRLVLAGARSWTGTPHFSMGRIWCFHAYQCQAELIIDDEAYRVVPGSCSFTPPWAQVTYRFGAQACWLWSLQFVLPAPGDARWALPVMIAGGRALAARLRPCLEWCKTDRRRAEVRLWDELAGVAVPHDGRPVGHPLVERARVLIEERLAEGLNVRQVAAALGITPTHLSRCFRRQLGCSCSRWLRRRRTESALHRLVYGDEPIREIAAAVGIPDLQHFNKVIRQELGHAPRTVRQRAVVERLRRG